MPNQDLNPQSGVGGTSYLYDFGTTPNTRTAVSQKIRVLTPHYGSTQALHQMGVMSAFNLSQSRTIDNVRGIGFGDKIAELVPSVTEPPTIDFERALLYLCNLWQAAGYAAGSDGPVRMLAHHRWPFDCEQQLVFSTLADVDLNAANVGVAGTPGNFNGGVKQIAFPQVTYEGSKGSPNLDSNARGHSAIITIYEACWFNSWSTNVAKDAAVVLESGQATVSDIHDFASVYGEFLATGNDPTIGQLGSIRFSGVAGSTFTVAQAGGGIGGGGTQSILTI